VTRLLLPLAAAALLALAGCGGDDEDTGPAGGSQDVPPATRTQGANAVEVGMRNIQFVPKAVTVRAGGTVKWSNTDAVPHTVTSRPGTSVRLDSGTMQPGNSYDQAFARPGKINYFCTIHPNQTGTVTVVP
jgi:plastocyanin